MTGFFPINSFLLLALDRDKDEVFKMERKNIKPISIERLTCVCVCVLCIHVCVNAAGFQGSITLPSGAKLREGRPDEYILTCTQPVMSAVRVCVCMCVYVWELAGQPSIGTVQQSRGRTGEC